MASIKDIENDLHNVKNIFNDVINYIPEFDITNSKILPYGLKPHTRSVSWIVEQVITQNTKYHKEKFNLEFVNYELPDTCLHDCEIIKENKRYFINIKITDINKKDSKNDTAAVEKLFMQYSSNLNYNLIYAVFGFYFENFTIKFVKDKIHTFSPQFLPIYVNPRNDKIQAKYYETPIKRSRAEFLNLLKEKSKSIILG